ncbi:MAG TPA: hypothetical protein VJH68_03425 [Candidatus Nanoarchaeia archaeon]|nr:hypothetical protein [Candidatus Nanoarchaeia archaeon]
MKKIILDTNAMMAVAEFKLDIFRSLEDSCYFPYQLYVLSGTIDELQQIKETQRGKFNLAAKLALGILSIKISAGIVLVISNKGKVDDLLAAYSKKRYLILTQDVNLKKRLFKPYLTIRQKKFVVQVE